MSLSPFTRAYRPLRPRTLLVQTTILVGVEGVLLARYVQQEAGFHWATHVLVGLSVWALVNGLWLGLKGAPARVQVLSILGWHLLALVPDLLFSRGHVPHDDWMDVFLGHISAHGVPGGMYAWLLVALTMSGLYALLLGRWLAARHTEADAGMRPGVGMSGTHLFRAQRPPATTPLAHRRYGPEGPPEVVLLHGLGSSAAFWRPVAEALAWRGHAVLVPDLLGFGGSRGIGTAFGLDEQADAVARLLTRTGSERVLAVGHSFGCAVAVVLSRRHPERVGGLMLVAPPAFADADRARCRLARRGWLAREVVRGAPTASVVCNVMCLTRTAIGFVAVRMAPHVPAPVARDSVQHTWPAYREALGALLVDNPIPAAIARPMVPTTVVLGRNDVLAPPGDVLEEPHGGVRLELWADDHLLPLHSSTRLAELIGGLAPPKASCGIDVPPSGVLKRPEPRETREVEHDGEAGEGHGGGGDHQ